MLATKAKEIHPPGTYRRLSNGKAVPVSNYYQAGTWRCSQSPTGAHHMVGDAYVGTCKFCGVERGWRERIETDTEALKKIIGVDVADHGRGEY